MNWFGESWGASVNDLSERCATPVGEFCDRCELPIRPDDRGFRLPYATTQMTGELYVYYHLICFLDSVGVKVPRGD